MNFSEVSGSCITRFSSLKFIVCLVFVDRLGKIKVTASCPFPSSSRFTLRDSFSRVSTDDWSVSLIAVNESPVACESIRFLVSLCVGSGKKCKVWRVSGGGEHS